MVTRKILCYLRYEATLSVAFIKRSRISANCKTVSPSILPHKDSDVKIEVRIFLVQQILQVKVAMASYEYNILI